MPDPQFDPRWTVKLDHPTDLRPIGDKVLVRPLSPEQMTRGGIHIPDSATRHPLVGHVLSVGPGRMSADGTMRPLPVKPGDTVFYSRYGGQAVKQSDDTVTILMSIEDVLAVADDRRWKECPLCGAANGGDHGTVMP